MILDLLCLDTLGSWFSTCCPGVLPQHTNVTCLSSLISTLLAASSSRCAPRGARSTGVRSQVSLAVFRVHHRIRLPPILVGWLVIEVEQLFTVLEQWRTAVQKINWALSRSNHTKCYPSIWLIFVIIRFNLPPRITVALHPRYTPAVSPLSCAIEICHVVGL